MKSIVRIVHLPSVVQSEFNEATRTLFLRKENKTTILFNNSSPLLQRSTILESIRWTQAAFAVLCQPRHKDALFHSIQIEPLMADGLFWRCFSYFYGPWQCNLLCSQWDSHNTFTFMHLADAFIQSDLQCIQAIHFFNQYVCSLGIEPTTFCSQCSSTEPQEHNSLPVFIQNILNCVPKTNKAFTGLERHVGKWLMTTFSFWGGVSL